MVLKWIGGKGRYVETLAKYLPESFTGYKEPFLGGASFYFYLKRAGFLKHLKPADIILSDTNYELIVAYIGLQSPSRFAEVMSLLEFHKTSHNRFYFAAEKLKSYSTIEEVAARFLYFNRACFSGIYRENKYGDFNVSDKKAGISWLPTIDYLTAHYALKGATIKCIDYSVLTEYLKPGDFVYLDPPYYSMVANGHRTVYGKAFRWEDHKDLKKFCDWCDDHGVLFMQSNSSEDVLWDLYDGYQINTMEVKYNPAGSAENLDQVDLIITNY
jgi:DNA adenine methylase